jgi:lauroyl/myristoyl acyltransferase
MRAVGLAGLLRRARSLRLVERAVDLGYALGWALIKRVPEAWAGRLFGAVADRMWRRRGTAVRRLEANLRRVVGPGMPEAELRELSRACLRSYCRYWVEVFRLPVLDAEDIRSRMHISGYEKIVDTVASGRGVVVALPHMGNYDHAGAWLVLSGVPFTTVAERLRPESLFDRFLAYRERLGMEVLPLTGSGGRTFATLAKRLRAGGVVCLVADRDLTAQGVEVEFFGRPARMAAGPAALAVQTGAAFLPATLWYEASRLRVEVHDEIPVPAGGDRRGRVATMAQAMAATFEEGIAAHPQDWHMLQRLWTEDFDAADSARPPSPDTGTSGDLGAGEGSR